MINRFTFLLILCIVLINAKVSAEEVFKGYIKRDVVLSNGEVLGVGERIECKLDQNNRKCCFDEANGRFCIDASNLSKAKVLKKDVAILSVYINQSFKADKTACEDGIDPRKKYDSYIWSYGVRLSSNAKGFVLFRVSHIASKGELKYVLPSMTKELQIPIDATCHSIEFTQDDIAKFLEQYLKVRKFLSPPIDTNLNVEVLIEVFSEFGEETYKNNYVLIPTQLPVDSAKNWPPN